MEVALIFSPSYLESHEYGSTWQECDHACYNVHKKEVDVFSMAEKVVCIPEMLPTQREELFGY